MYRRSIYVSADISEGEIFSEKNIKIVRPGDGAHPEMFHQILGKFSRKNFKKGEPLKIDDII